MNAYKRLAHGAIGLFAMTIGALALLGHIVDLRWMYAWEEGQVGMAVNTAAALMMLGLGSMMQATESEKS